MEISRTLIKTELSKVSSMIPITICKSGTTNNVIVYITKHLNSGFWATNNFLQQDIKIFPSRQYDIVKIGNRIIQSKQSFKEENETIHEANKVSKKAFYAKKNGENKSFNK
jgi:hypothetical protein